MLLKKELTFATVEIVSFSVTPAAEQKAVLNIAMPLSLENAEILGVDWAFNGAIARDCRIALDVELEATDFRFPDLPSIKPDVVHKLKLSHTEEAGYQLSMIVKAPMFHAQQLLAFVEATNKDTFALTIKSRQGDLFEGQDGTRVDLKPSEQLDVIDDFLSGDRAALKIIVSPDDSAVRQNLMTHYALPFGATEMPGKGRRRHAH